MNSYNLKFKTMDEKLGIDKLKEVFKGLVEFGETLELKASDGKLTWIEVLTSSISLVPDIFNWISNGEAIKDELFDLDMEERDELVEYLASELELDNQRTEDQIEAGAELIGALDAFRVTFKKVEE